MWKGVRDETRAQFRNPLRDEALFIANKYDARLIYQKSFFRMMNDDHTRTQKSKTESEKKSKAKMTDGMMIVMIEIGRPFCCIICTYIM
jgi:hypothetical protein